MCYHKSKNQQGCSTTDHFSKWTEATAVPDKNAKSVASACTPLFTALAVGTLWLGTIDQSFWIRSSTTWRSIFKQITVFHLPTTHKQMASGNVTIERSKNRLSVTKETAVSSSSPVFCLPITHFCMPQPSALHSRSCVDGRPRFLWTSNPQKVTLWTPWPFRWCQPWCAEYTDNHSYKAQSLVPTSTLPRNTRSVPSITDTTATKKDTQRTLKRAREEPDNDSIYISQKHKQTKTFVPLSSSGRKYLSTTIGLTLGKVVYYGHTRDLAQPRRTYKTHRWWEQLLPGHQLHPDSIRGQSLSSQR